MPTSWGKVTSPWRKKKTTTIPTNMNYGGMGGGNYGGQVGYKSEGEKWAEANVPAWSESSPRDQAWAIKALYDAKQQTGAFPQLPGLAPMGPGGGSRGGGGGGGGGGGAAGMTQEQLDWLLAQIGRGRPQNLAFNPVDLPDPGQYLGAFDTGAYNPARQGIGTGLDAMRARGNQAFDTAVGELNRYQNPYRGGLQTGNPDQMAAMERMAAANNATGALQGVVGEGVQADRAMSNVLAMLAANDQARQAANLRATEADRAMMDTNLGLEGNMLNLGVNMAQAKGQSAWDQMLKQAQLDAANQEMVANWQRQNTVGDTNVANRNAWNQSILQTLMQLVGSSPGAVLPAEFGGFA